MATQSLKQDRIKVLHIIETLDIGGAECVLADIVNNLPHGIIPVVCCFKHLGEIASRISSQIEIFSLNKREGNNLLIPFKLAFIMRQKKIQAVHIHNWGVFVESVFAAMIARVPIIIHMAHGGLLQHPSTVTGNYKKRIRRVTERICASFCNQIIAVSSELRKNINKEIKIPLHKITVMRNGINISSINEDYKFRLRTELDIKRENFIICFVGRLAAVKNIPILLSAIQKIYIRHPSLRLLIAGDGPEKNKLHEMVQKYTLTQNVRFLGSRNDIKNILSISDLFVLPSLSEGVSISLLEAMSLKVPVIATKVGGNVEVVIDKVTGLLVDSNNDEKLAKAISYFIDHPEERERCGQASFHRVKEHFNISKNIDILAYMYSDPTLPQEVIQ